MKNIIITVIVIFVIVAAGTYFYINRRASLTQPTQMTQTAQPSTVVPSTMEPTTSTNTGDTANPLLAGGNSYLDKNNIFSVLYPNDYVQDMQGDTITRFYKKGPTQQGQTEMYDGVIVSIQTDPLNGKTLEQHVDEAIKQSTSGGMAELTSPKAPIIVNNQNGFTYKIRGLGESTYITLQKNDNPKYAVTVVYAVNDPQNKGFQTEVDNILATLQILQ